MIAKRLLAVLAALALIGGAWAVRDRVIDADSAGDDAATADVLVCAQELVEVCRAAAPNGLAVVGEDAAVTLDRFSSEDAQPTLWLTFQPFPQMVNTVREQARQQPFGFAARELASSPLVVVTRPTATAGVVDACGDPVGLACLAGDRQFSPLVSSVESGIGLLSIASAVADRAGGAFDPNDPDLALWARTFHRTSSTSPLTGGTAIRTLQIKPNVTIAIGADAEVSPSQRDSLEVLAAEPGVVLDVVLMEPFGIEAPGDLAGRLSAALEAKGWLTADASGASALPEPGTIVAIRAYWRQLS